MRNLQKNGLYHFILPADQNYFYLTCHGFAYPSQFSAFGKRITRQRKLHSDKLDLSLQTTKKSLDFLHLDNTSLPNKNFKDASAQKLFHIW